MTAGPQGLEESPDSRWQGCRVTPGGGNPRESATEKRQPRTHSGVMVKRWGKSPPRDWQQDRHGKPHPEQCQIGASRGGWSWRKPGYRPQGCQRPRGPGWQLDPLGNKVGRGMVIQPRITVRGGQNPAYRLSARFHYCLPCGAWVRSRPKWKRSENLGKGLKGHRGLPAQPGAVCRRMGGTSGRPTRL